MPQLSKLFVINVDGNSKRMWFSVGSRIRAISPIAQNFSCLRMKLRFKNTHHKRDMLLLRETFSRSKSGEENMRREICSRATLVNLSHVILPKTIGLGQPKYRAGCALYFCNHPFLPSGAHNSTHVEHFEPAYPITLPPRSLPKREAMWRRFPIPFPVSLESPF